MIVDGQNPEPLLRGSPEKSIHTSAQKPYDVSMSEKTDQARKIFDSGFN